MGQSSYMSCPNVSTVQKFTLYRETPCITPSYVCSLSQRGVTFLRLTGRGGRLHERQPLSIRVPPIILKYHTLAPVVYTCYAVLRVNFSLFCYYSTSAYRKYTACMHASAEPEHEQYTCILWYPVCVIRGFGHTPPPPCMGLFPTKTFNTEHVYTCTFAFELVSVIIPDHIKSVQSSMCTYFTVCVHGNFTL